MGNRSRMDWGYSISGFGVGILVGMTGVGGGSLMAPLLILMFGFAPATAVGTDLWFAGLTKAFGGYVHHRQGGVDWQVFRRLIIGSLPAAVLTLLVLHFSETKPIKDGFFIHMLGGVLILTAVATVFRRRFIVWSRQYQTKAGHNTINLQLPLTIVAGAVLGVLVTLTSVGAGALGVTMILCLYPLRMSANRLVATDIVHAIPLTLIAGLGYALLGKPEHLPHGHIVVGNVDLSLLALLLIGSIPGIIIGARLTKYFSETTLRLVLAMVLLLVGLKMVLT